MDWYYAEDGQQLGPVPEAEFTQMVQAGTVSLTTLVWHAGLSAWQPYQEVSAGARASAATASLAGRAVCAECGQSFAHDEMMHYGNAWVCATCKPLFEQKLREGVRPAGTLIYAGLGQRFGAKLLDGLLFFVVYAALGAALFFAITNTDATDPSEALINAAPTLMIVFQAAGFIMTLAYNTYFLGRFGATPGKMLCKIQVVTPDGNIVSYGRACGRYFAELLEGFTFGIGLIIAFWDQEKRTLHDRICNTRVVVRR